ncbi:MAG: HAD family phosphatase [Clostridia bacterium]|nr:HAD family phosphatase [Clostridia bacterium]
MKTYIFDFDGTLVDSMPIWSGVMKRILDETNTPYGADLIKTITPLGTMGTSEYFTKIGCPLSCEEIIKKMAEYLIAEYTYNVPAKKNVIETLKELKKRGASLNVLTASPHETLDPCLKRLGIFDIFDNVWSCNDFNTSKADPQIYHRAAEKLGAAVADVAFLDDNIDADKTAKRAGMTVFGVYDDTSRDYIEDMKAVCDRYIYDFSELL